jgi:hypothetical protein
VLRYLDVVAPLVAAPVVLAFDAPVAGYALGVAAWILVRAFGIAADRRASSITNVAQQVSLRLAYRFTRISLLVAVAVLAFKGQGRADGVTALLVITFAFTIHLSLSIIHRPRLLGAPTQEIPGSPPWPGARQADCNEPNRGRDHGENGHARLRREERRSERR